MRIIPDDAEYPCADCRLDETCSKSYILQCFDGIEISDDEWDEIAKGWFFIERKPFPQYLKELISLAGVFK
jgi:hypothetical protein